MRELTSHWYAGMAMQGLVLRCGQIMDFNPLAADAYAMADTMLQQRSRKR